MGVIKKIGNNNILNVVMLLVAIAVVSFFFPSEGKFSYEYEQGKPWGYSLLTAPFDMPVNMDSVTAMNTKDSIDSRFAPIYMRVSKTEKIGNRLACRINTLRRAQGEGVTASAGVAPFLQKRALQSLRYRFRLGVGGGGVVEISPLTRLHSGCPPRAKGVPRARRPFPKRQFPKHSRPLLCLSWSYDRGCSL